MDKASGGSKTPVGQEERGPFPRWLVWMLGKWWGLFALLGVSLVVNCLLLLLANGWYNWLPAVKSQVAGLLALGTTQPFVAGMVVIGVPVLTLAGLAAHLAIKHDEQRRADGQQRRIADEAARRRVDELAEALKQPPAKETPPNVNAPSGLPRATSFVGRAETLAELMVDLRQGGAIWSPVSRRSRPIARSSPARRRTAPPMTCTRWWRPAGTTRGGSTAST